MATKPPTRFGFIWIHPLLAPALREVAGAQWIAPSKSPCCPGSRPGKTGTNSTMELGTTLFWGIRMDENGTEKG